MQNLKKKDRASCFFDSDLLKNAFKPELPEIIVYCAFVKEKFNNNDAPVNNQYIFTSLDQAVESGLEYRVASWIDINEMADGGHIFKDVVINTPQGRFVWHEICEEDFDGTLILNDCMYRAYGAPEDFSKQIEQYLYANHHFNSKLIDVKPVLSEGVVVFIATLSSNIDGIFTLDSCGNIGQL